MPATYSWDVYATLDGFASFNSEGDWGGYWGKEGPEFLAHRAKVLNSATRLVLGANTFREFMELIPQPASELDPVNARMKTIPTTVISSSLKGPYDWPVATLVAADAAEYVAELKKQSDGDIRSHGSLSLNRALMAAGLVDRVQISVFPVVSGRTGTQPVFRNALDFDLELLSSETFDGRIQELAYRPRLHGK
jgi:dihydrofolate reductase